MCTRVNRTQEYALIEASEIIPFVDVVCRGLSKQQTVAPSPPAFRIISASLFADFSLEKWKTKTETVCVCRTLRRMPTMFSRKKFRSHMQ